MRSCNNYSLFKVRISVFLIIVYARSYSHRTDASRSGVGCVYVASLSFIVCEHRGACNQRKEGFVILLDQFGNTPFPLFILVRSPAGNKQAYPVATGNLLGIP